MQDPRTRRNPAAGLSPDLVFDHPLQINSKQRVSVGIGEYLKLDGSGRLTVDVEALRTELGL
ncbi:MAG: hypothetical protein D6746_08475 [Bacteroidetes bacterium]|nr:MAG: hypothetical protein D6746_08475 [Bacteroidota bacterium]